MDKLEQQFEKFREEALRAEEEAAGIADRLISDNILPNSTIGKAALRRIGRKTRKAALEGRKVIRLSQQPK